MITVVLSRDDKKSARGFKISGHSSYDVSGRDIICAAISVLGQTAIASLLELTELKVDHRIDEKNAVLECKVIMPGDLEKSEYIKASAILDSFEIGCRKTADSYGRKYINIIEHHGLGGV